MLLKKIGIFLPHSKQHPTMSKEFMNGLKLSLPNSDYKLCIEGIGFGDKPENIINIAQKFINQEEVIVSTGILGHRGLNQILDFFDEMKETLIYADFGSTKPINLTDKKTIYSNSLNLYDATYSLGKYFISKGYKNITTSTCYYESGYDFTKAMHEALYEKQEAEFSGHFITPLTPRKNEAELMTQFVSESNPDALFAFHNGIYAEEHANFITQNKINTKKPLYTLPFSVDNKVLAKFPETFNNTKYVSSWSIDLKTEENKNFIKHYHQKYNKIPSIFSVLGYENGLLIHEYLNKNSNNDIIGPRGKLNSTNNRTNPKQHLWELKWLNNTYKLNHLKELKPSNTTSLINTKEENNWHNAYLCH